MRLFKFEANLRVLIVMLISLFCFTNFASANYISENKHRKIYFKYGEVISMDVCNEEEPVIYLLSVKWYDGSPYMYVSKYAEAEDYERGLGGGQRIWIKQIKIEDFHPKTYFINSCFIDPAGFIRCIGHSVYVIGRVISNYVDGAHYFKMVLDYQTGKIEMLRPIGKIFSRQSGNVANPAYFVSEIGNSYFIKTLAKSVGYEIEYVSIGECYDHTELAGRCMVDGKITQIDEDSIGHIYFAGIKSRTRCQYIVYKMSYALTTTLFDKSFIANPDVDTNCFVEDMIVDDWTNDIYLAVKPESVSCYISKKTGTCIPVWMLLVKLNRFLDKQWETAIDITDYDNKAANIETCTLSVTPQDVYCTGNLYVFESLKNIYTKLYVISYSKKGKRRDHFIENEKRTACCHQSGIFILSTPEFKDRFTLIAAASDAESTDLVSYWLPNHITITLDYHEGWNPFSLPVYPDKPIYLSNLKKMKIVAIYRFEGQQGYQIVKDTNEILPGIGYWIKIEGSDVSYTFRGMEILGVDVKCDRGFYFLGSCSYPYSYQEGSNGWRAKKDVFEYVYDEETGYRRIKRVTRIGMANWVFSEKDNNKIHIHILR